MKSRPVTRLVSGLLFVIEDKEKALNPLGFKAFFWQRVKDSNCSDSVKCRKTLIKKSSVFNALRVSL